MIMQCEIQTHRYRVQYNAYKVHTFRYVLRLHHDISKGALSMQV